MNTYFHTLEKQWYSTIQDASFGKNAVPLHFINQAPTEHCLSFKLTKNKQNMGPLIGIMTGRRKDHTIAGNGPLFKSLQEEVLRNGGLSFVFTPEDVRDKEIHSFVFIPSLEKWTRIIAPLPHLIYNRVPFRRVEKSNSFQKAREVFNKNEIPFFNEGFINKFELYQQFRNHPKLKSYFPETIRIEDKAKFIAFLKKHKSIYLKPCSSSQGKGIFRLLLKENGSVELTDKQKQIQSYSNLDEFFNIHDVITKQRAYLAQKEIRPLKYNGHRFDLRILVHFDGEKQNYKITGVGVRQSFEQELTTHVPNGGRIIPYQSLQSEKLDDFISLIAEEIGQVLSREKGIFGEFSIDAGLDESHQYVIYEVNSKPMSFDEKHIEAQRIKNLSLLFFHFSGFHLK